MRTYPRSVFRSEGTSECTLVPVFVPGEHLPKPPFWKTTLLSTPEIKDPQLDVQEMNGVQEIPLRNDHGTQNACFTVLWCHERWWRDP